MVCRIYLVTYTSADGEIDGIFKYKKAEQFCDEKNKN